MDQGSGDLLAWCIVVPICPPANVLALAFPHAFPLTPSIHNTHTTHLLPRLTHLHRCELDHSLLGINVIAIFSRVARKTEAVLPGLRV